MMVSLLLLLLSLVLVLRWPCCRKREAAALLLVLRKERTAGARVRRSARVAESMSLCFGVGVVLCMCSVWRGWRTGNERGGDPLYL